MKQLRRAIKKNKESPIRSSRLRRVKPSELSVSLTSPRKKKRLPSKALSTIPSPIKRKKGSLGTKLKKSSTPNLPSIAVSSSNDLSSIPSRKSDTSSFPLPSPSPSSLSLRSSKSNLKFKKTTKNTSTSFQKRDRSKSLKKRPTSLVSSRVSLLPSSSRLSERRKVRFSSSKPTICLVFGKEEYNRKSEWGEWWIQFEQNKVCHRDVVDVYWQLDIYKLYEIVPTLPAEAQSHVRFDLLKTEALRQKLLDEMSPDQARQLSMQEIQDFLNDDLFEYNPHYRNLANVFAYYMDSLVLLFKDHEPIYRALVGLDDPEPVDSPYYFHVDRVFQLYAETNPYCQLPLPELVQAYAMEDEFPTLSYNVGSFTKMYFQPRGVPWDDHQYSQLLTLLLIAVALRRPGFTPPPVPSDARTKGLGSENPHGIKRPLSHRKKGA